MIRRRGQKPRTTSPVVVEPPTISRARRARGPSRRNQLSLRRRLAAKAYARTAAYDAAISNWFARELKTARRISALSVDG